MFTGIVQSIGNIENIDKENNIFSIKTNLSLIDCKIGSSICCDGVCLTVLKISKQNSNYLFDVNVGEETINRTNLIHWIKGSKINLEKSLKVGDEISGHFVYGHVDLTLALKKINKLKNSWEFNFDFNTSDNLQIKKFIVQKGSVSINGISLTIANIFEDYFSVSIIPHTFENTNLHLLKEKNRVNIEFDPLARYISKIYEI